MVGSSLFRELSSKGYYNLIGKTSKELDLRNQKSVNNFFEKENANLLKTESNPYVAMEGVHAIAVLTEWDEFKSYDWKLIYKNMQKPAFVFDGRNVLDRDALQTIGFIYKGIGF